MFISHRVLSSTKASAALTRPARCCFGTVSVNTLVRLSCKTLPSCVRKSAHCGLFATDVSTCWSFNLFTRKELANEQTIRAAVSCEGVGLHSGAPVHLRIVPAPAGTGIVFRRTDLDGFEIEATGRNVAKVSYATSLMKKGVLISTTEHVLSAFVGMGLDNAIVELDNLELPILDGSALPIVEMVQQAGLRRQKRLRQYLRVLKPVEVREGPKFIGLYPA